MYNNDNRNSHINLLFEIKHQTESIYSLRKYLYNQLFDQSVLNKKYEL